MKVLALLWMLVAVPLWAADFAAVVPGRTMVFPADHGAHPEFRTEWWYATGWLNTAKGERLGFQVTFFRSKMPGDGGNPSRFALDQVLFAHAAVSDPKHGKLMHGQRIARAGFGLAAARVGDMALVIDDWSLKRGADGVMRAVVNGDGFELDLRMTPTQPVLLQGDAGYSRKGSGAGEASYYYTMPQLRVAGRLVRAGKAEAVTGKAWLDREWSSTLLNKAAVGWDWLGLNMDDGGAMTLFRVRQKDGTGLWAGGSYRSASGALTALKPADVRWVAARRWRSGRTKAVYPVAPVVEVRLDDAWRRIPVTPLMDDQELDSRRSGGPVYWEGAVTVPGGRGYLEMTGYLTPLKM